MLLLKTPVTDSMEETSALANKVGVIARKILGMQAIATVPYLMLVN